jgi:folate-dependent phosphoribosylglycinamide formyltransferase PurN
VVDNLSGNTCFFFAGKILNIHPALLPKFKGLNTHQRAIDANEEFAGATVHFVTNELDSGAIILQKSVAIESNDTAKSLAAKVFCTVIKRKTPLLCLFNAYLVSVNLRLFFNIFYKEKA